MCGIAGVVSMAGAPVDQQVVPAMCAHLAHRGPDGEGFLFATGEWGDLDCAFSGVARSRHPAAPIRVALGHRRLAILDLSDRGLQPMSTPDGQAWIVFNGEIYNHREIACALRQRGHVFTTRTDTEVLLHAYAEWGEDCLGRLEGMYAFAVWDSVNQWLFCARDRLGIKPFYYAIIDGQFLFASEIKAFTAHPGWRPAADDEMVAGFLMHGNCDYGERTVFRGVKALPPAFMLRLDPRAGDVTTRRYWTPGPAAMPAGEDAVARVRECLIASIRKHLISDVKAGSCLSGGLDSSTVVGLIGKVQHEDPSAASAVGERLSTFTSCYADSALDERQYALAVARSVDAAPHLVFPSPADFWSEFERMAWHQDMPFGGLSYYAQWRVMRAASEAGVKVLLDGQGGDEVFGGYAKFRYAYLASLLRSGSLGTLATEVAAMLRRGDRYFLDLRHGYRYAPAPVRRALNVDSVLRRVLRPEWASAADGAPASRWWRYVTAASNGSGLTPMGHLQVDDITIDTLPQLLRMEDRSSMAFSIEARVPLLDHEVVELGLALPDSLKLHAGWSKYAVRQAMAGIIPDTVRLRTTKLGFAAPDRAWIAHDLRPQISELLSGELKSGRFVDQVALRRWYASGKALQANAESDLGLFRILSLEMWMRGFGIA